MSAAPVDEEYPQPSFTPHPPVREPMFAENRAALDRRADCAQGHETPAVDTGWPKREPGKNWGHALRAPKRMGAPSDPDAMSLFGRVADGVWGLDGDRGPREPGRAMDAAFQAARSAMLPAPVAEPEPSPVLDRARGILADAFWTAARWYEPLGASVCSSCDGSGVCPACEGNAGKAAAFERLHDLVISAATGRDVLLVIASLNDGGLDAVMPAEDASAVLALLDAQWRTV